MRAQDQTPSAVAGGLSLISSAFRSGEPIPVRHTCDGADLSPPLSWDRVPNGTQSLALIVDDPDAPSGVFTHWVIFNLSAGLRELPEGVPKTERPDVGGRQGQNDFGKIGYNGPCPPPGPPHRYRFTLCALDGSLDLAPGASKHDLLRAMEGRVLGQAQLIGTYQRQG